MKKFLLISGILAVLGAAPAEAQTHVYETAKGSGTITQVSISTTAGNVQVDSKTAGRWLEQRFSIEVWNDDDAEDLNCGFDVNLSTISTSGNYGRRIGPRTSVTWSIPDAVPVYCAIMKADAAATALAVITQLK